MNTIFGLIGFWIVICLVVYPSTSLAQTSPSSSARSSAVDAQVNRGEGLFLQRCSICHLDKPVKPTTKPSIGPKLNGLLKNDKPDQEKTVRKLILEGTPNMPGFQYGLTAKQIDDLIAYLKAL